ncbi:MAG: YIP1 family protein [Asgard group archaeon]|nr:YIP1 family protein [Asgard group archaeon]
MSVEDPIVHCPICNETSPQGYLLCPFCGADLTIAYQQKVFAPVDYKEFWYRFKSLIVRPRVISQEIADNPDSKGGFLFSVAISFGMALQVLAFVMHVRALDWKFYPLVFLLSWIATFILPLLVWGISSLVIRIMAQLIGGNPSKKQIRAAVGYGMLPVVFAQILSGIFYLIALPWVTVGSSQFTVIINAILSLRNSITGYIGLVLEITALLAAGVYIVFITKPSCEFSWVETVIATGIPLIFFVVLLLTYFFGT